MSNESAEKKLFPGESPTYIIISKVIYTYLGFLEQARYQKRKKEAKRNFYLIYFFLLCKKNKVGLEQTL